MSAIEWEPPKGIEADGKVDGEIVFHLCYQTYSEEQYPSRSYKLRVMLPGGRPQVVYAPDLAECKAKAEKIWEERQ